MPFVGSIVPQKVANLNRDERRVRRDREDTHKAAESSFRQVMDEADLSVSHVEATEEVRQVKGNDSAESHEDRISHRFYDAAAGRRDDAGAAPGVRLDIRG